jgi:DNA-binding protein H-NS
MKSIVTSLVAVILATVSLVEVLALRNERLNARKEAPAIVQPIAKDYSDINDIRNDLIALRSSVADLSIRLDAMGSREKSENQAAMLAAVDSNIETVIRSSQKNAQDVQELQKQMKELIRSIQGAFNTVASEIQSLKNGTPENAGNK